MCIIYFFAMAIFYFINHELFTTLSTLVWFGMAFTITPIIYIFEINRRR